MAVFSPGKTNRCAGAAFYDLSTFFRLHHHRSTTMIMTTTTTTTAEAAAAGVDDDDDEKHDNNEEWVFRLICLCVEVLSVERWGHGEAGSCELEHGVARQPCHVPIYCNSLRHTATYYSGSQIAAKQIGCFHQKRILSGKGVVVRCRTSLLGGAALKKRRLMTVRQWGALGTNATGANALAALASDSKKNTDWTTVITSHHTALIPCSKEVASHYAKVLGLAMSGPAKKKGAVSQYDHCSKVAKQCLWPWVAVKCWILHLRSSAQHKRSSTAWSFLSLGKSKLANSDFAIISLRKVRGKTNKCRAISRLSLIGPAHSTSGRSGHRQKIFRPSRSGTKELVKLAKAKSHHNGLIWLCNFLLFVCVYILYKYKIQICTLNHIYSILQYLL